jgi:predicted dehydrogenase
MHKKISYGMVGGGRGALIGKAHRTSIALNGDCRLAAGAFSSSKEKNLASGRDMGVDDDRIYLSFDEMAHKEAARQDGIDFVVIVTPNHLHFSAAKAFLEQGIHVVCDKPLTISSAEGIELKRLAHEHGCLFMVTYTYTGHAMAREARRIVAGGEIGDVTMVMAEYASDWLLDTPEKKGHKQAIWRTDPKLTGISNCVGDIGTHVENMVAFITGLKIEKLIANLDIVGQGRKLDDNAQVLVKYTNGASGVYWTSQVAAGYENGLKVRIFGSTGSVAFDQEDPDRLRFAKKGAPPQVLCRGAKYDGAAAEISRLSAGQTEGYFVAFANLYAMFTRALERKKGGEKVDERAAGYPTLDDGIQGVIFVEKCVESMRQGNIWIAM